MTIANPQRNCVGFPQNPISVYENALVVGWKHSILEMSESEVRRRRETIMPRVPTEKELLEGLDEYSAHADELANPNDNEWGESSDHSELGEHGDSAEGPLDRLRGSVKRYDQPLEPLPDWDAWFEDHGVSEDFMTDREQPGKQKR